MLLFKEWNLFKSKMIKDKSYWVERFNLLSSFRNPVAHSREVPNHLKIVARGYCEELLGLLETRDT